jgi:hypothetical protein
MLNMRDMQVRSDVNRISKPAGCYQCGQQCITTDPKLRAIRYYDRFFPVPIFCLYNAMVVRPEITTDQLLRITTAFNGPNSHLTTQKGSNKTSTN